MLLLSANPLYAQNQSVMDLLDKVEEIDGVTTVVVTKKMFELFTKTTDINIEGESVNEVLQGLEELKIFEVEKSSVAKVTSLTFSSIVKELKNDGYENLLKIKSEDDNVEIYILEQGDVVKHLFLIAQDDDNMQLISLLGDINLEQISKLSGTLNIDELDLLNKK